MKKRNKIYRHMTMVLTVIYVGLLTVLYLSERTDGSAAIDSFGDAFWYSLVTLTTVGYGDLIPVTPLGHAVGVVFLFLSAGIMMTLFGASISFVTSEGLPLFLLGFQRKKDRKLIRWLQIFIRKTPKRLLFSGRKKTTRWNSRIIRACLSMCLRPGLWRARKIRVPGAGSF